MPLRLSEYEKSFLVRLAKAFAWLIVAAVLLGLLARPLVELARRIGLGDYFSKTEQPWHWVVGAYLVVIGTDWLLRMMSSLSESKESSLFRIVRGIGKGLLWFIGGAVSLLAFAGIFWVLVQLSFFEETQSSIRSPDLNATLAQVPCFALRSLSRPGE